MNITSPWYGTSVTNAGGDAGLLLVGTLNIVKQQGQGYQNEDANTFSIFLCMCPVVLTRMSVSVFYILEI